MDDQVRRAIQKVKDNDLKEFERTFLRTRDRLRILLFFNSHLKQYNIVQECGRLFIDLPECVAIDIDGAINPEFVVKNYGRVIRTFHLEKAIYFAYEEYRRLKKHE